MTTLNNIAQYDLRMLRWCGKSRLYPQFIRATRLLSKTGDGYLQLLSPLIVYIIEPQLAKPFIILLLTAFAIERPLYFLLKNTLKRRRPPDIIPDFTSIVNPSDEFSFPSGHTMAAFVLAGVCVTIFGAIASPLYLWACLVAISRVILGVHFPSDLVAGAIIGTVIINFIVQ